MSTFNDFMEGADESRKRRRYSDIMLEARQHRSPASKALIDLCTYRHGAAAKLVADAIDAHSTIVSGVDVRANPRDLVRPTWGDRTADSVMLATTEGHYLEFQVREQTRRGRRQHRLYARCPDCERWIPASRTHQHCGTRRCRGDQ